MVNEGPLIIENETGEISLKELVKSIRIGFAYIKSKWIIVIVFMFIGAVLGFTYALSKKPMFTATTTFVMESNESSSGLAQYAGLASMAGLDFGGNGSGGIFQADNIIDLYKSRTMIEKALLSSVKGKSDRLLIDLYLGINGIKSNWIDSLKQNDKKIPRKEYTTQDVSTDNRHFSRRQDSVLGKAVADINRKYLNVAKPDKKLSKIQVDVQASDEAFAKMLNDALVKNVNDFYIQTKTKKSLQNVKILQKKTDSVRAVMNGAIYSAVAVSDATPNLNPTREVQRLVPVQKAQFSAETSKAILSSLVQNLEMAKMSLLSETPLIQVVDTPILPLDVDKTNITKLAVIGGLLALVLCVVMLLTNKFIKGLMA